MKSINDLPVADRPLISAVETKLRTTRVRVRATTTVLRNDMVSVSLQLRIAENRPWLNITHKDHPLIVGRQFSQGTESPSEALELYGISALKRAITKDAAVQVRLFGSEYRPSDGHNEWRYWADISAPLSVAFETNTDGTLAVVGLI